MNIPAILKRKYDHIPISGFKYAQRISDRSMNWHSLEQSGRMVLCDCCRSIRLHRERYWCSSLLLSRQWKSRLDRSKWNIRDLSEPIKRISF